MRPIKPTDILFSSTSYSSVSNPLNRALRAANAADRIKRNPQNLYVDPIKVHNVLEKLSKKNKLAQNSIFVPSKDTNMLVPEIVDPPVIESAAFKAYIILSENNIFLQSELDRSNRGRRRNLLQGNLNQNDIPATDQQLNSLAESGFLEDLNDQEESTNENHNPNVPTSTEDSSEIEDDYNEFPPAMIRGLLLFRVLKPNTKIKSISLNFKGDTRTNWPEGIPPKKTEFMEIENILNYNWKLFDVHDHSINNYYNGGANHINTLPENFMLDMDNLDLNDPNSSFNSNANSSSISPSNFFSTLTSVTSGSGSKKKSKFSIVKFGSKNSNNNSNLLSPSISLSQNNLENSIASSDHENIYVDSLGNYVFQPGDYVYTFEKEIPNNVPETTSFTFGFVNYWLNLEIARQAKFKGTLRAKSKVNLIRNNTLQSIEDNYEPIVINKTWENRLDYSILIASSQIVLNSFVPINIKLTPLDKNLKVYKIKIFLIEILEYWCKNRKVHRLEPQRKFLLLEHKPQRGTNLLRDDISDVNDVINDVSHKVHGSDRANHSSNNLNFLHLNTNNSGDNGSDNENHVDLEANRRKSISRRSHGNNNQNLKNVFEDDEDEYISSKDFSYQLFVPEKFTKFSSKLHLTVKHKNIQSHHWIKIAVRLSKVIDDFDVADDTTLENIESNNTNNSNGNNNLSSTHGHAHNGAASLISNALPKRKTSDNGGQTNSSNLNKPKRKHYEISIDSPITLVHPLCTQANTLLPVYEGIGDFNPYTFARTKSSGEVELITDNNPLFPPEILTDNAVPEYQTTNSTHKSHLGSMVGVSGSYARTSIGLMTSPINGIMLHNVLDLNGDMQSINSNSSNANINNISEFPALENTRRSSSIDGGMEQFNHIDNEFEAEITPDMFRANLYTPRSIQLDLTTIQAQPRNSHLNPADITDDGKKQLSPNFRALSPSLKGLKGLPGTYTSTSADLINDDSHHPRVSNKGIHILEKPSIIPPLYDEAKNNLGDSCLPNTKLNHLLNLPNLLTLPPPPPYEILLNASADTASDDSKNLLNDREILHEQIYRKPAVDSVTISASSHMEAKDQNTNNPDNERDIADAFSFQSDNPDLPMSVVRATSPKLFSATELLSDTSKLSSKEFSISKHNQGINSPILPTGKIPNISVDGGMVQNSNHFANADIFTQSSMVKKVDNEGEINQPILSPKDTEDFHSFSSSNNSDDEKNRDIDRDASTSDNDNELFSRDAIVPGISREDDRLPLLLEKSLTNEANECLQKLKLTSKNDSMHQLVGNSNGKCDNLKINFWSPINSPSRYNHNSDSSEDIDISDLSPI